MSVYALGRILCVHKHANHTHSQAHRHAPTTVGVMRKRKANKYLLTQQRWRMVVHWWKQKAEDEELHARKPAGCGRCAPLVPTWKTRERSEDRKEERERARRKG